MGKGLRYRLHGRSFEHTSAECDLQEAEFPCGSGVELAPSHAPAVARLGLLLLIFSHFAHHMRASPVVENAKASLQLDGPSRSRCFVNRHDYFQIAQPFFTWSQRLLVLHDASGQVVHLRGKVIDGG